MSAPSSSDDTNNGNGDKLPDEICLLTGGYKDFTTTVKFSVDNIKDRFKEEKDQTFYSHNFKLNGETFRIGARINKSWFGAVEDWCLNVVLILATYEENSTSEERVVSFKLEVQVPNHGRKLSFKKPIKKGSNMGWDSVLRKSCIDALPNNILHLLCTVTLHSKEKDILSTKRSKSSANLLEEKLDNNKKMKVGLPSSKEKLFTDFAIESEDGLVIKCHRNFLASHSPVFKAMLESDMKEAKERRMKLDFSSECLQHVVDFFYDITLENEIVLKHYEDFLHLADKYDIDHMKLQTEDILIKNLSTDLMVNYYCLGDLYNAQNLKEAASTFIANNKDCFKDKEFLAQLKKFDPDRIVEIMSIAM